MKQIMHRIEIATRGQGLVDVTRPIVDWVSVQGVGEGLLTVFCRHTSASLLIQENADPDVLADLKDFFARIAPPGAGYRHDAEGPDDMPAHIKAALTAVSLSVPVGGGRLLLGTWQGLYLFEHRAAPHRRELVLHLIGQESSGI